MSYLDRLHTCNNFDPSRYHAFTVGGQVYGQVRPAFAEQLTRWDAFQAGEEQIALHPELEGYTQRSQAVAPVFWAFHQQGVIDTWVDEAYPVTHTFGGEAALEVERAATSFLGVKTFGVHVNGLVRKRDGIYVWVGTRSLDKPFWPGKLDQMVAGGQPVGLGLLENVIKEAQEEASVPPELAATAQYVGAVSYRQETWRGLDNSTLFLYDLWLPEDFVPRNMDGEVLQFELLPLQEIARITEHTDDFKDNCNLVNMDLLVRMGLISPQHPDYAAILHGLYAADK